MTEGETEAVELLVDVLESIKSDIFSRNKAIGKSQMEPEFMDEDQEYSMAKRRLRTFLTTEALNEANPEW